MGDTLRIYGSDDGYKLISTPGTPVAIGGNVRFKRLTVQAIEGNAGNIKIGGKNLDPAHPVQLTPLSSEPYLNGKLSYIYIDGLLGDGVTFKYEF